MQGLRYYNGHVVPKRLIAKPTRESRCASFKVEAVHFLWSFRCRLVDRCRSVAESDASRALWVRPLRIGSTVLVCFRRSAGCRYGNSAFHACSWIIGPSMLNAGCLATHTRTGVRKRKFPVGTADIADLWNWCA